MFFIKAVKNCIEKNLNCENLICALYNFQLKNLLRIVKGKPHLTAIKMNTDLLEPPKNLNGMRILDKDLFKKTITVSSLVIEKENMVTVKKLLKKYFLKLMGIKPVQSVDERKQIILFNPNLVQTWNDLDEATQTELKKLKISEIDFSDMSLDLGYENWNASTLLKSVLPKDEPPLTSYSLIGHIIHLNIKEHLLDYKHVIAQILLDKVPNAETVVYKKNIIDNTYRNFEMEVLCGKTDFIACVKENKCTFKFDFSKVYWNPRLSTEHSRIVEMLQPGDVLFDVFAGVGPFSIPASCKGCLVFANDLNPESFKWLNFNISLNKKAKNLVTFNKDGSDFISNIARENLLKLWQDEHFSGKIHFVMNLPASALTFLRTFKGLISKNDLTDVKVERVEKYLPIMHCHFFVKHPQTEQQVFEQDSGIILNNYDECFHYVRTVSNGKTMQRATFVMSKNYLLNDNSDKGTECDEPLQKRHCKGDNVSCGHQENKVTMSDLSKEKIFSK